MCIRSQTDAGGYPPDTRCLPNGLIVSPDSGGQFWRHGCTDPSWESDYCLKAFNACEHVGVSFLAMETPVAHCVADLSRHLVEFEWRRTGKSLLW
jgi:hypothetical protein